MKRKIFSGIMGGFLLLLAACGGKEQNTLNVAKDYVYRAEPVEVEGIGENTIINDLSVKNGKLYIRTNYWLEEESYMELISQNPDGSELQKIQLKSQNNVYYSHLTPDGNGNYYMIMEESFEDASDPENYIWRLDLYLTKLDAQGNEAWKQKLGSNGEEDYWVKWMQILPDNRLVVCDSVGIHIYDADGKKIKDVTLEKELELSDVYLLEDGTVVVGNYSSELNKNVLNKINVETGEVSEDYNLPANAETMMLYAGKGYDLFLVGNGGVFGYNLGETQMKKLMDFIDSDMNTSFIYNIAAISENEFYGVMELDTDWRTQVTKFTKVDPAEVADRKILTLACNNLNWNVREHVVEFNKTNPEYRIVIEEYAQYNTSEDFSAGATKLNSDIASGKVPDILLLDWQLPVDSYEAKGLFEDLYPYIDQDAELKREDFFPNVLSAYESQGKLYRLVSSFTIYTLAGKSAEVGEEPGWTLEELNQLLASKPEGTQILEEATRSRMLSTSMQMAGEQFVNWETGECHFNSDSFISLLEFLKQFPEEIGEDYYDDNYWDNYTMLWRDGKILLQTMYLADFSNYNYVKKGIFGEDITLVGFPVAEGMGSTIEADMELAMSSKSKYKEGVWEFMRYFLTDEYQSTITYGWPMKMSQMETLKANAMKRPFYEDENGTIIEYDQTFSMGGQEIPIEPMTEEEINELVAFIMSVDQKHVYNDQLEKIVAEEAAPYFAGQKNAKEVADIIQSRMQIYVNENR